MNERLSPPQRSLIADMLSERKTVLGIEDVQAFLVAQIDAYSKKQASSFITELKAVAKSDTAPPPSNYAGPVADHVMVSKKDSWAGSGCGLCGHPTFAGKAHASVVGKVWNSYHFAGECPAEPVQTSGLDFRAALEQYGKRYKAVGKEFVSFHLADPVHADGQVVDENRLKVRVRLTVDSDWVTVTDASVHGHDTEYGNQRPGAEYSGKAVEALTRMLADIPRSLAAWGELNAECGCCSLALTDGISIARRVGPVCWLKHYDDFPADFVAEVEARVAAYLAGQPDDEEG
jgi:hypothetical protein